MKRRLLPLLLALLILLAVTACVDNNKAKPTPTPAPSQPAKPTPTPPTVDVVPTPGPEQSPELPDDPQVTDDPEVTETPAPDPVNPLTGEYMEPEQAVMRPVAIILNNIRPALPMLGQSQADIIYEVLTEGGITRMLGIYQSMEGIDKIGSIRSARTYFLELALGHDAVLIHAGGSDDSYDNMSLWGITHLDGVRGPYMSSQVEGNLMWRDPDRLATMSTEHTVVTTGAKVQEMFSAYSFRKELDPSFVNPLQFKEDGTPSMAQKAAYIKVPFSSYKTGEFTYNERTKLYMVKQYGSDFVDGNTGEQVGVTNVLILRAVCKETYDYAGHITVDLSGGTGYYACGGKVIAIKWSKSYPDGALVYTDVNGNPITLGVGRTYVNIVPIESNVTFS